MARHMRLPNGFGQISRINKRLRNPYRAMVTVGQRDDGKYIRKTVGYYKTYNEAYTSLIEYNKKPDAYFDETDMSELFDRWYKSHSEKVKDPAKFKSAWNYAIPLYNMKVKDVRQRHILEVLEAKMPPSMKPRLKSVLSLMFDYARLYEMCDSNPARELKVDTTFDHKHHIPFDEDELKILWDHLDMDYVDVILIGCYTGLRPGEILSLKTKDFDRDAWIVTGGSKTKAGRDRVIPIHPRIRSLIDSHYSETRELLIDNEGYDAYYSAFLKITSKLDLAKGHAPHDTRVTFVTRAKAARVDEYAIKRIIGHSTGDLTEDVYTKRSVEWLHSEIAKIV